MKRWMAVGLLLLLTVVGSQAQNSNSVTVTVVAPPTWTITISPMNYYQNKAATMTITVTAGTVVNTCTATWDATALALTFPANLTNPVALTAAVSTTMTATLGAHTVFITCPLPVLTMNSAVVLPNAQVGVGYVANLATASALSGGVPPYTWTLNSGSSLPPGLSLSSSGIVSGTPTSSGSSSFSFTVSDSSGLSRVFEIDYGQFLVFNHVKLEDAFVFNRPVLIDVILVAKTK